MCLVVCLLSLIGLPQLALADARLALEPVASNLDHPIYVTYANDGSGRLFVVEQAGRILILLDHAVVPIPFLDIRHRVISGGEMGLLSVAFHPNFAKNGRFFVDYTEKDGQQLRTVIAEYHTLTPQANRAAPEERVLLRILQPFANHHGGQLQFGPDGYLYVGMGDGGGVGDPLKQGQSLRTLLGKILRIDVNAATAYSIPPDNPFVDGPAPEIWAYGLRNPWRFSFDRTTGRLFAADVGQDNYEEVNLIEAGGNYGWNIMEGDHCFPPTTPTCPTKGLRSPIAEYRHTEGTSITGGYVYRGRTIPEIHGTYVFGDFGSGTIWGLREASENLWERQELLRTKEQISSFGEDADGELYVVGYNGVIFKIVPAAETLAPATTPTPSP